MSKKVKKEEKKDLKPVEEKKEIIKQEQGADLIKKIEKREKKQLKKCKKIKKSVLIKKHNKADLKILEGNMKADLANEKAMPEDHSFFKDLKKLFS